MNVNSESAFTLLRIFMRLEFALKEIDEFIKVEGKERASVEWSKFDYHLRQLDPDAFWNRIDPRDRATLLGIDTGGPPQKMFVREVGGRKTVKFEPAPALQPELDGVMDAARRVRNNLVHGGKERYEQQRVGHPVHDQQLVDAAAKVMGLASRAIPDVSRLCWE